MKNLFTVLFVILIYSHLFSDNRIPIPDKQVSYSKSDIIANPENDEQFVYNQLLIVFEPSADRNEQEKILESIDGEIVGGLPSYDIYQIRFENSNKSFSKLEQIQSFLEQNGTGLGFNGLSNSSSNVAAGNIARGGTNPGQARQIERFVFRQP